MLNTFLVEESLSGGENTVLGRGREGEDERKWDGAVSTEHQPSSGNVPPWQPVGHRGASCPVQNHLINAPRVAGAVL